MLKQRHTKRHTLLGNFLSACTQCHNFRLHPEYNLENDEINLQTDPIQLVVNSDEMKELSGWINGLSDTSIDFMDEIDQFKI